jgi:hypothetical protein
MKLKFRKVFMMMVVVALIVVATTVTALADDTITTGEGDASATVPIEGTISALTVSVTHPATIAYSIDPNTGDTYGIVAPEIIDNPRLRATNLVRGYPKPLKIDGIRHDLCGAETS